VLGQPEGRVDEIPIAGLRRDCAIVLRGMLLLAIVPGAIFVASAMHQLHGAASLEFARLNTWKVWLPLVLAVLGILLLRRLAPRLDRTAVMTLLWSYAALAAAATGAAIWVLGSRNVAIHWGEIAAKTTAEPILLAAELVILILASWLIWYSVLGPLRAALRLLHTKLQDGRSVIDAMSGIRAAAANLVMPRPSAAARTARLASNAVAVLLGIFMVVSVIWLLAQERYVVALILEFALLAAIFGLVRLGQRVGAVEAKKLLAVDVRPPVLFLRSFQDDAGKLDGEWGAVIDVPDAVANSSAGQVGSAALNSASARTLSSIGVPRLEEAIATEVGRLGPFVAIGAPGELLPELGAARDYYDNDTWQSAILRWIDMAQLIVKLAGPTRWIRWELGHIISQGAAMRLIIVFPKKTTSEDRAERWHNVAMCFDGTPWQQALSAVDPQTVMALRFKPDGGVQAITQAAHRWLDAVLAMRILLDGMIRDGYLKPIVGTNKH
jgi:hypothetical protein